jgi:hypothetical protein
MLRFIYFEPQSLITWKHYRTEHFWRKPGVMLTSRFEGGGKGVFAPSPHGLSRCLGTGTNVRSNTRFLVWIFDVRYGRFVGVSFVHEVSATSSR